jgi:hypothetical protein
LAKEKVYEEAALSFKNKKSVIIYDRGVIDNKAYITSEQFKSILLNQNLKELELLDNYDMVVHLVTAADGKEEYYTLENNQARSESAEEARALDKRTVNAWRGHKNLQIIDNSTNFEEKLGRVLNSINNLLGNPVSIKKQRKYLIDLSKSNINLEDLNNVTKVEIEQIYLESLGHENYEKRLRKRTLDGESTYYFTIQKKEKDGISKIVMDKKITEKEYLRLIGSNNTKRIVKKTRYTFIEDKQFFKLDVFQDGVLALLEIEPTDDMKIKLPDYINIVLDVTDDPNYQNFNIAEVPGLNLKKENKKSN